MNPFQFAVANVKKKAQELFNNSAPVQGARMYGQAFQSPAVQKFANNAGNYLNKGLQQVSRQAPQYLYNQNIRPTVQGLNAIKNIAVPTAQAYGNIVGKGILSYAKTTPAGQFIANNQNLLAKSSQNPIGNAYLKAISPFRNPVTVEDVGNIASGVWGTPKVASNLIGGGIGYGINKFTKQESDADAYRKGIEFSSKVSGIGKLLETPLAGLVKQLNPTAAQQIGELMDKGLTKQAFSQLWKNVKTAAITGGIEGGAYGAVLPAKNAEQWARNIFENATQFAAFSGGTSGVKDLSTIGFKGSVRGLKALQNNVNTQLKKGMTGTQLQEANAVMAPIDILVSHEGAPDRARVEYYKNLIRNGKKVDPIVIVNEGAKYGIDDGKHRFQAYKELGYNQVPTIFKGGEEYRQMMARADSRFNLPSKSIPKELEGLAAEARKYKSAEEFVKAQQFKKISAENPMIDTYHTGIRNISDIKTFKETLSDPESFVNPDFTKEMAKKAFESGEIMVYSSKPLDKSLSQFVTPSKMMASDYAGSGEVYSKKVNVNDVAWISGDEGNLVGKSQLTDIWNQANKGLQGAESSVKLPVEPQIKVVNGKVKVKMKPISVPNQESPVLQSSSQELAGSGAGGGSSIKNTKEFINPQDPYFNVSRLNVSNKKQQAVKAVIEESKPQIEQVVGKKLSNKEVVDFSNQSAKVLHKAVNREQTKQWSASMLKAREQLAKAAQDDSLTPEFLDTLINVKSQGADIARKLQSLSINADPKTVTAKQAILEAVLKVTDNSDEILQAAKGVNFNDQAQATAFYRQFVKPKAEDWLTLVRYNSMLSSPNTHIINTSSNLQGTGIVAPIEKTILGGIDWMRSKATGTGRRYYAGEGIEYAKGYYSNLMEASKNFTKVMRGEALSGNPDIRQLPLTTKKGLARTAENVLNYPMRLLEGMDQFFSTLTQAGVERSLNYRASKGVNVGNIGYKAEQEAANRLFRGDVGGKDQGTLLSAIDQVTNLVFRARSNENPIVRTIAQFTLPFVKTPMNIVKQMVEYSPAGVLTIPGAKFKQEQLAKAVMGAGVALGASQLLSSDKLTWSEPTNDKQRNAFKASGLQPYAIKIGDKWVSYAKLHPVIGFNLAMVAALNDSFKNKKLSESEVETALTGLSKWWGYFADQSYIKNMGDLVASARGDLTGTARLISNYPTQVIPFRALMSWVERLVDPYQRQADPNGSILEKQLQLIGSQIPGIAGNVPTRKNLYGEPIENQNRFINAFSPAKITTENPQQKAVYDDMVNTSIMKKQIKDMQDQAKKGNVVSGGAPTGMPLSMQMDIQEEGIKNNLKYSNKYVESIGGKLYIKQQDGSVKVISLGSSKPTGNIIQQAKQQTNKESAIKSAGVSTYFRTDMPDAEKLQVYKALGTNASDVELKALASLDDNQQASVLYSLLKDRQWKQEKVDAFIKSDVLTNSVVSKMEQQGLINSNQATQLKNYIKSTNVKLGKARASKPKKLKIPKLKKISVKKTKLKIKLPKAPTAKLLKPKAKSSKYFS